MPATVVTEYFIEAKPLWVGKVGAGGVASAVATTIPAASAVGLTDGNVYIVTVNRTDPTGTTKNPASSRETFIGKLSSSNFINCVRQLEGVAQAWDADTVLEVLVTATQWNKLIEGLEVEHNADGTHKTDKVVTPANLQKLTNQYAADAGSDDSYAITLSPVPSSYAAGMMVVFKANTANTGAATLNVNSLGAKTIKKNKDDDLNTGDIKAGQIIQVVYDGTNFQLLSRFNPLFDWIPLTDGATVNIDLSLGNKFVLKEMGGNRSFTLSNILQGKIFELKVQQDGTGSRTITHPNGEEDFDAADVNTSTDIITIGIDLPTGTKVRFTSDTTLPTGISAATDYFVVRQSATTIKIATSLANAQAGTTVDITAAGTGGHHMQIYPKWNGGAEPDESTDKYYWDTFGYEVLAVNPSDSGSYLLEGHGIDIGVV